MDPPEDPGAPPVRLTPTGWGDAARDAVGVVREHGVDLVLVLLGSTIPRILQKTLLGLRIAGWTFVAVGAFAILRPELFLEILPFLVGGLFLLVGALVLWTSQKVADATSAVAVAQKAIEAYRERTRAILERSSR